MRLPAAIVTSVTLAALGCAKPPVQYPCPRELPPGRGIPTGDEAGSMEGLTFFEVKGGNKTYCYQPAVYRIVTGSTGPLAWRNEQGSEVEYRFVVAPVLSDAEYEKASEKTGGPGSIRPCSVAWKGFASTSLPGLSNTQVSVQEGRTGSGETIYNLTLRLPTELVAVLDVQLASPAGFTAIAQMELAGSGTAFQTTFMLQSGIGVPPC